MEELKGVSRDQLLCHFSFEGNREKVTCAVKTVTGTCGKNMDFKTFNMKRHLLRFHTDISKQLSSNAKTKWNSGDVCKAIALKNNTPRQKNKNSFSKFKSSALVKNCASNSVRQPDSEQSTTQKSAVDMEDYIIGMVIENGTLFSVFASQPFLRYHNYEASLLGISLTEQGVRTMIMERSHKIKQELINRMKNNHGFLKVDFSELSNQVFVTVNLQYFDEVKLDFEMVTLGVKSFRGRPTGPNIKSLIDGCLKKFELSHSQVLGVTSDTVLNTVCAAEKCVELGINQLSDDEAEAQNRWIEELLQSHVDIEYMKSASYVWQALIKNWVKRSECEKLLITLSSVCKAARGTEINKRLSDKGVKCEIDCNLTRWENGYEMVKRCLELKPHFKEIEEYFPTLLLSTSEWENIRKIGGIFEKALDFSKALQLGSLTPGNLYYLWKKMENEFEQEENSEGLVCDADLYFDIIGEMKLGETDLFFNNDIMLCGIYIDPKARPLLDTTQLTVARSAFVKLAGDIEENVYDDAIKAANSNTTPQSDISLLDGKALSFEMKLDLIAEHRIQLLQKNKELNPTELLKRDIMEALDSINLFDRSRALLDVIHMYPKVVQKSSLVCTSFPSGQISLKRLFSVLEISRCSLVHSVKPNVLEAIYFLRTNGYLNQ